MILISLAQFQLHLGRTLQLYRQNLSPFLFFPQPGRNSPSGWEGCLMSKRNRKQLPNNQNSHQNVSNITHVLSSFYQSVTVSPQLEQPRAGRSRSMYNVQRKQALRRKECTSIHTIIMATTLTLFLVTVLIPVQVQ